MTPETPPSGARRYRILGTLGRGGFGTVYRAELLGEGGFTKEVALKVLHPDAAIVEEVASRMRDEARILGLVRHRAIVQVEGLVRLGEQWAIVMEYVSGVDLRELISVGPVPRGPALEIIEELASALHQAYTQPGPGGAPLCLVHRDIKPSNIALTAAGEVKLLDFGTARANFSAREAKTRDLAFGTLDYMSPERMMFEDLPAGDIYALCAVLFEMLTASPAGRTAPSPVRHAAVLAAIAQRLDEAGADEPLRALVLEGMAFDPAARPDALALSQSARRLRSLGQQIWLADWARDTVPKLLAGRTILPADEHTGAILVEGGSALLATLPQQGPADEQAPGTRWVPRQSARTPPPPEPAQIPPEQAPLPAPPAGVRSIEPAMERIQTPSPLARSEPPPAPAPTPAPSALPVAMIAGLGAAILAALLLAAILAALLLGSGVLSPKEPVMPPISAP